MVVELSRRNLKGVPIFWCGVNQKFAFSFDFLFVLFFTKDAK